MGFLHQSWLRLQSLRRVVVSLVLALAVAMVGTVGCQSSDDAAEAAPAEGAASSDPATLARVCGRVTWEGELPERRVVDLGGSPDCARTRTEPLLSEDIVVSADRSVESVLVFLEIAAETAAAGASTRASSESADAAHLVARLCRFEPHLLAVRVGQPVQFGQAGQTFENFHLLPQTNDEQNFAITTAGGTKTIGFEHPEPGFIKVKSDIHPWMSAWIAVLPHPWFAVTGADGRYAIEGLPPGRQTLVLRHPLLGEQRVEVEAAPGTVVTRDFVLRK